MSNPITLEEPLNVAAHLTTAAAARPDAVAVAEPKREGGFDTITFADLDARSDAIARGLVERGVAPGTRLALLVPPGIEFVTLVFALLKSAAVQILVDPGIGKKNLIGCLAAAEPEGFVAVPKAQAVSALFARRFPAVRHRVTVGRRWFWGGDTLAALEARGAASGAPLPKTIADDPAAIIFTSGSTGPPKGVLYTQRVFDTQVTAIRDRYGIEPGGVDVAGFPLFGLFNAAMGVTTVFPDMDFTRPARVDPEKFLAAANEWKATQSFGSPALWNRVGRHCAEQGTKMPTLRTVLSAGAPVPAEVLERIRSSIHAEGGIHTPYGATEALPVATIEAAEVLGETRARTEAGEGVCVGRRFPSIDWKVIRIDDGPLPTLADAEALASGEIGELIVTGPQVTRAYVTRTEWNGRAKIADGERTWHRMGDAGWLDDQGRFWFCGRVAHRVRTADATLFTIRCEAIFNRHPEVARTALVGVGPAAGARPVIVAEPRAMPATRSARQQLRHDLLASGQRHPRTRAIETVLLHPALPVDIRHNAKIFREQIAEWAAKQVSPV